MDMDRFKALSIKSYLLNMKTHSIAASESDQARQMFGYLISQKTLNLLNSNDIYKQFTLDEDVFLPIFCTITNVRQIISQALAIPDKKLSFSDAMEFLYKLADAIWQSAAPELHYPSVVLDTGARRDFKSAFQSSVNLNSEAYPLRPEVFALIANIIDTYRLRAFQKLELNALTLTSHDPTLILGNQPRFSAQLIKEIERLISKNIDTSSLSSIYSLLIHGFAEDDLAESQQDNPQQIPPAIYTRRIASLIRDYLETGIKPHQNNAQNWGTVKLSLYEDARPIASPSPVNVSVADLLKEDPINHSLFRLHAFMNASLSSLNDFFQRLDNLTSLYQETMDEYWRSPTTQIGAKNIWADQLKSYMEAEARLRVADSTLSARNYERVNQVLNQPFFESRNRQYTTSTTRVFSYAFFDKATSQEFPAHGALVFAGTSDISSEITPIVTYTLDAGLQTFESWDSFNKKTLNNFTSISERKHLLRSLSKKHTQRILEVLSDNPERVDIKLTEVQSDIFIEQVNALLTQQKQDFVFAFELGRREQLPKGLEAFCEFLDRAVDLQHPERHIQLLANRQFKLIESTSNKALSFALALHQCPAESDLSYHSLTPQKFALPDLGDNTLRDDERRLLMIEKLQSKEVTEAISGTLSYAGPYFPHDRAINNEIRAMVLNKIATHRFELMSLDCPPPTSNRYKYFAREQALSKIGGRAYAKPLTDIASISLLGMTAHESETIDSCYSAKELDVAEGESQLLIQALHAEIGGGAVIPDLAALARYIDTPLATANESGSPANKLYTLSFSLYQELILDLPGFHKLEDALVNAQSGPSRSHSQATRRALAVSAITDYLYPPKEQQPGYICGFNLNSIHMGESPVLDVRNALQTHLRKTFPDNTVKGSELLAFTLLTARYAPELQIDGVPRQLLYGQTLDAVHFRHAVAFMETVQPCSTHGLNYKKIMAAYIGYETQRWPEQKKIAVLLLKQIPTLHFSMCQGVIPEADIAHTLHDNTIKAIEYVQQQEELESRIFTRLAQLPPLRKDIASSAFKKAYPGLDTERPTEFTNGEIKKYFLSTPASRGAGRAMKMTILEKYMTCDDGITFNEEELGLKPYPGGACSFQALFDSRFEVYKENYLEALASRMALALHGLAEIDRNRILNAYKYITLSFTNAEGQKEPSYYGLIALYKESDEVQYAYELFCPSGTIRLLPQTGQMDIQIKANFAPSSEDYIWHERPYIKLPALDQEAYLKGIPGNIRSTPDLMVSFYSIRRQTSGMQRDEKIRVLCRKMVETVFGKVVDLSYTTLRSPTPYEAYKGALYDQAVNRARMVLPGYALYQDIKRGEVTVGTVIFGALEILSFLLPFVGPGIKALNASINLSRVAISSASLNFSKLAISAASAIKPLQNAIPKAFLGVAEAANPFGAVVLLFQGGYKGALAVRFALRFVRKELDSIPQVSRLIELKHLPDLNKHVLKTLDLSLAGRGPKAERLSFFKPDFSTAAGDLNIQQQLHLHAYGVDISEITPRNGIFLKDGKNYIHMQNNVYEIKKRTDDHEWYISQGDIEGPPVTYSPANNKWKVTC